MWDEEEYLRTKRTGRGLVPSRLASAQVIHEYSGSLLIRINQHPNEEATSRRHARKMGANRRPNKQVWMLEADDISRNNPRM